MEAKTHVHETYAEWQERRRTYLGGSEISKVIGVSRWGCPRSVANDKLGVPKDFDDSDKMEFRRGRRLEHVAVSYYEEKTGREVKITTTSRMAGKPHLGVNMDRLVFDPKRPQAGYLEAKVVGKHSFLKVRKEGIPEEWILQVQWGCAVANMQWGSYAIYCPELDELEHFDVEADRELGASLVEKGDDFWQFHVEMGMPPDSLPMDSPQCVGCVYTLSCHSKLVQAMPDGEILRPDLEGWAARYAEAKGMGKEAEGAAEELKEEFIAAVKEKPGKYRCGKYLIPFTITSQRRFDGSALKAKDPALYESLRKETIIKTVPQPKEV